MKTNSQFQHICQSATIAISDRVLALKACGKRIIPLQVGDPDFSTPAEIVEAAISALREGQTHYGPSRGFLDLRTAISNKIAGRAGYLEVGKSQYDPESEILVSHGGVHAYYLALQSVIDPDDDVLIPDPSWATHTNMVKLLRGNAIPVPAPADNGFLPPMENWEKALTPKTRVIVINYPANPTGVYPNRIYIQQLLEFAHANHLWVVSDEVYDHLFFENNPVSVTEFPEFREQVILVNSLSKTYAMTGWRVGYLAAPAKVIENALIASQNSITCVAPFIQRAATFALTDAGVQEKTREMREAYLRRRDLVMRIYTEVKNSAIDVIPPMGAFYFFLDLRALRMSSTEMCEQILEESGVALVPGNEFGSQGKGFIRMTIAAAESDVEEGFRAIMAWTDKRRKR